MKPVIATILVLLSAAVVYDLYLWIRMLRRMEVLRTLRGTRVAAALTFLEEHRKSLGIADVEQYSGERGTRLIVMLKGVSIIGLVMTLGFGFPGELVTGAVIMHIDDDKITVCYSIT
jgi:hypothetical protein